MLKKLTRWVLISLTLVNLTLATVSTIGYTCVAVLKDGTKCCGTNCGPNGCTGSCTRDELRALLD
jgi:hypothetical protein